MKKIGEYVARGQYTEGETVSDGGKRVNLFDGDYTTGYKVTSFKVWSGNMGSSSSADVIGKLGTVSDLPTGSIAFFNADDVREIAWAASAGAGDAGLGFAEGPIIDRENLLIEEVFVYTRAAGGDDIPVNYLIEFDKYELPPYRGSLAMVENKSQG